MGEQRGYRDVAPETRQFPAIVQIDRVARERMHSDTAEPAQHTFERFAQHAYDYVARSLDRANERIEHLTEERDMALARVRELEWLVSLDGETDRSHATSIRPWRAVLSQGPVEPASRIRWAIAFLFLLALPLLGIAIVDHRIPYHTFSSAAILEPVIIVLLSLVLIGTWTFRSRR